MLPFSSLLNEQLRLGPCCGAARGQNDCESRLGGGLLRQRARRPVEDNHAQGGRAALQKSSGQDEEWLGAVEGAVDAAAGGGWASLILSAWVGPQLVRRTFSDTSTSLRKAIACCSGWRANLAGLIQAAAECA